MKAHKHYIERGDLGHGSHLEVSVYYNKGDMSYFTVKRHAPIGTNDTLFSPILGRNATVYSGTTGTCRHKPLDKTNRGMLSADLCQKIKYQVNINPVH